VQIGRAAVPRCATYRSLEGAEVATGGEVSA
jgi:hypothetical protein